MFFGVAIFCTITASLLFRAQKYIILSRVIRQNNVFPDRSPNHRRRNKRLSFSSNVHTKQPVPKWIRRNARNKYPQPICAVLSIFYKDAAKKTLKRGIPSSGLNVEMTRKPFKFSISLCPWFIVMTETWCPLLTSPSTNQKEKLKDGAIHKTNRKGWVLQIPQVYRPEQIQRVLSLAKEWHFQPELRTSIFKTPIIWFFVVKLFSKSVAHMTSMCC